MEHQLNVLWLNWCLVSPSGTERETGRESERVGGVSERCWTDWCLCVRGWWSRQRGSAGNISPGAGSQRRSCLPFSLHNAQSALFKGGSCFLKGFIINGCIIANGWCSDSSVLCFNQPFLKVCVDCDNQGAPYKSSP